MWETWVQSLGCEDPLEKGKAIRSSILAWRIPWIVQSVGRKEIDTTERLLLLLLLYHLIVCDSETAEIFLLSSNNHSS